MTAPTHQDLCSLFAPAQACACPGPLRQLPGYFRPPSSARRRLLRIEVFECSKCHEIIEVLETRSLLAYPASENCTFEPPKKRKPTP